MSSKYTLVGLTIVVACTAAPPSNFTCAALGDEPIGAHINSPLNEENVNKILDKRGVLTEAEIVELLGPPATIEVGAVESPYLRMAWEDVSRIELTSRDGQVVSLKGMFSPRLVSRSINYPTFRKIKLGSSENRVRRELFLGFRDRIVKSPDGEATTRIFETSVQFYVTFSDGKVTSALRVESLNR